MIVGILSALFLCAMPVVSLYVWKLAWRDGVSLYDRLGFFQIPFGENARSGIDASVPISGLVAGSSFAVVGVLAAPELMEVSVPLAPCRRGGPGPDRERPGAGRLRVRSVAAPVPLSPGPRAAVRKGQAGLGPGVAAPDEPKACSTPPSHAPVQIAPGDFRPSSRRSAHSGTSGHSSTDNTSS
jgi:hypothetical protein